MSTENKIKDVVGDLISGTGPSRPGGMPIGMHGPETPEQKIAALEADVGRLYDALQMVGREIDRIRKEVRDS